MIATRRAAVDHDRLAVEDVGAIPRWNHARGLSRA